MFKFEILTPGEKVKAIREKLGLKQYEIAGKDVTRNLISYIENNKASLTPHVAIIIASNINQICRKKEINFEVKENYLLEDIKTQIDNLIDDFINHIIKSENHMPEGFEESIFELEKNLIKYDLPSSKVQIYYKIAQVYSNPKEFDKAYKFYVKAYENCSRLTCIDMYPLIIIPLSYCCIKLEKYQEAIDFLQLLESANINLGSEVLYKLRYNKILAYMEIKKYNEARIEIERLEKISTSSEDEQYEISTLKAQCLKAENHFGAALELYSLILSNIHNNEIEKKLIVLCNIIEIYELLKDIKNIKRYINSCMQIIDLYEATEISPYKPLIFNDLGMTAKEIQNYELSKKYFYKTLEYVKFIKNINVTQNAFENLIQICTIQNDAEMMDKLKNKFFEYISLGLISKNTSVVLNLINYYNQINDRDSIQSILNFIL